MILIKSKPLAKNKNVPFWDANCCFIDIAGAAK